MNWLRLGGLLAMLPWVSGAQEPVSNLGLPAVAAFGVHVGFAQLERSSDGPEIGAFLDLGWLRGRSLRLQGEVAFQRATLTEYLALEDTTFHGDYFDLSNSEPPQFQGRAVAALANDPRLLEKSGRGWTTAELALEYGFTDTDDRQQKPVENA